MQNKYVGDVGDFGKHGLLRFLSGMTDPEGPEPRLRVGLIWYMQHDEIHGTDKKKINGDGRFTGYLDLTRQNMKLYGNCDPELWSKLGHLVGQDRRCVHCAEEARLLPEDTKFYDALLYLHTQNAHATEGGCPGVLDQERAHGDPRGGFGLCGPGQRHRT